MILVDANILARTAQPGHSQYQAAVDAVAALRLRPGALCVVPQVLYEYWVVATRPVVQNGLGMTAADAADLAAIVRQFRLCRDERAIFPCWQRLILQYQVLGKAAHDARLVAAMERHGISQILTFNSSDFRRYPGIVVLDPVKVASGNVS